MLACPACPHPSDRRVDPVKVRGAGTRRASHVTREASETVSVPPLVVHGRSGMGTQRTSQAPHSSLRRPRWSEKDISSREVGVGSG
jgi:hypothetical protein